MVTHYEFQTFFTPLNFENYTLRNLLTTLFLYKIAYSRKILYNNAPCSEKRWCNCNAKASVQIISPLSLKEDKKTGTAVLS